MLYTYSFLVRLVQGDSALRGISAALSTQLCFRVRAASFRLSTLFFGPSWQTYFSSAQQLKEPTHHHLPENLVLLSQLLIFSRQKHYASPQLLDAHFLSPPRLLCRLKHKNEHTRTKCDWISTSNLSFTLGYDCNTSLEPVRRSDSQGQGHPFADRGVICVQSTLYSICRNHVESAQ